MPRRAKNEAAGERAIRFDRVIEALMVALLVFAPLAFGVVRAWSEFVALSLVTAIAVCFALKLLWCRGAELMWSWAYLPLALFVALAAVQLLPLPASVVKTISPNTWAMQANLLGDLPDASDRLRTMTLSFYPLATAHDLRLLLAAACLFVVVLNVYRRPQQVKRLLAAVSIIGGGIAVLALAQQVVGADRIYGAVPTPGDRAYSGPFVCHSHYGQFANLSIGAALGLLLVKVHEAFRHGPVRVPHVVQRLGQPQMRVVWYLAALIVLAATTVFLSLTRGGMVSLLIASGFTTLVLASRRALKGRGWIMLVLALAAFIVVLYVGFEAVYDRLATLHEQQAYQGRWQILEDLTAPVKQFPVLGTGLGTHKVVYPMFDRSTATGLAAYAENEYAQTLEETGLVGLGLVLAFLGIVWWAYAHNVRRLRFPIRSAAFGLGLGLLAVLIHSFSDFGQHLPAIHYLTAISCALLLGMAHMGRRNTAAPRWWDAVSRAGAVRTAFLLGMIGLGAWTLVNAYNAWWAEAHWQKALAWEDELRERDWQGTNAEYAALISDAAEAADWEPGNVEYKHWLNVYRWRSVSRVTDPETGRVVITPRIRKFARRIVDELNEARALCPTFGATYCVVGQLEKFILGRPTGAEHIRTGYELSPCSPTAVSVAARLDVHEGKLDASLAKFQRAIALGAVSPREVIDIYLRQANRPDLALTIAGDSPSLLLRVADELPKGDGNEPLAADLRARAIALQKARCEEADAPPSLLVSVAETYRREKDYAAAIRCYRRALARKYGQVRWRLALARLLVDAGQVRQAIHQARICLRLRPQMKAARKLIEDLVVLSDTGSK